MAKKKQTAVEVALANLRDDEREWTLTVGKKGIAKRVANRHVQCAALQMAWQLHELADKRDRVKVLSLAKKLLTALEG